MKTKFQITAWNEKPTAQFEDGSKVTAAEVTLAGTGDGMESGTFHSIMYYRPEGTSASVSLMRITGTVDGRAGTFVLQGHGTYDGAAARTELTVVPGSGTGALAGVRGTAESVSTHSDYPYMPLTLTLEVE